MGGGQINDSNTISCAQCIHMYFDFFLQGGDLERMFELSELPRSPSCFSHSLIDKTYVEAVCVCVAGCSWVR